MIAAGEQGCLEAQIDLADLYLYENEDVKRDPELAFYWMNRAAKQGDQDSLTTVGRMYSLGEGVKQNADKAKEILEKRAEKNAEKAPIRDAIFAVITEEPKTATTLIAEAEVEIKPQAIPALLKGLVDEGVITKENIKVAGAKGTHVGYKRA
jgi:hypothetical protein